MHALLLLLALAAQEPEVPSLARAELADAFRAARLDPAGHPVHFVLVDRGPAEGFTLRTDGREARVEAADRRGLLYGALELAGRIRTRRGEAFLPGALARRPFLRERGLALAIVLPWDPEAHRTVADPEARREARWWFQDETYWRSLLDTMARARLDWLHLLPPWDLFQAREQPFAEVFLGQDPAAVACRERLARVLAMAHERAIRVALDPGAEGPDAATLRRVFPDLDQVLNRARPAAGDPGAPGLLPWNGGLLGLPWPVSGGRAVCWPDFSYGDRLHLPSGALPAPPLLWELRAGGGQRLFPWFDPEFARRSVRLGAALSGRIQGLVLEAPAARMPRRPEAVLARPGSWRWPHQRDALALAVWGRLAYDPDDGLEDLREELRLRFGGATQAVLDAWQEASRVLPLVTLALGMGPDRSFFAPELETGGGLPRLATGQTLDTFVAASPADALAILATGGRDGRAGFAELADLLLARRQGILRRRVQRVPGIPAGDQAFLDELAAAEGQLASLAAFHAARLRAALALLTAETDPLQAPVARQELARQEGAARVAWEALSFSPEADFYGTFPARERMRVPAWHWRTVVGVVRNEARQFGGALALAATAPVPPGETPFAARPRPPEGLRLVWKEDLGRLRVRVEGAPVDEAVLLHKPLPATVFFRSLPMRLELGRYVAELPREDWGHLLAAEVRMGDRWFRVPWFEDGAPWGVVPPRDVPAPPLYGPGEAVRHLDPARVDPADWGALVVGPRAWRFHHESSLEERRKLLDLVARGFELLVLEQDWARGRYDAAWLPEPPDMVRESQERFDPGGVLDLEPVQATGILGSRILPSPGWTVHGNGGIASRAWGRGRIWLVQARLLDARYLPAAARDLLALLRRAGDGGARPFILVDPGSEGARHATSFLADLALAHDLPFRTLGEVVAATRGLAAAEPVPARAWDDRLLQGRGGEEVRRLQEEELRRACSPPPPASREELEARRPGLDAALRRALGLAPEPPRTPLRARRTGVLPGAGFRLEKVVLESRPGFPVTLHAYVPDGDGPFPVILNAHGHWRGKKAEPLVQLRAQGQARSGFLAVVVDSPGIAFEGDAPVERRSAGPHNDFALALGGLGAAGVYTWDLVRVLDWLATRTDADLTRVGITGSGGGGQAAAWAFALDRRITCAVLADAVPRAPLAPGRPCLCSHEPGLLAGADAADYLALRAPAPILFLGAGQPREVSWEAVRATAEALRERYALVGAGDAVRWRQVEEAATYGPAMRREALAFFQEILLGRPGPPLDETGLQAWDRDDPALRCLPPGAEEGRSMLDLVRERLAQRPERSWSREQVLGFWGGGEAVPGRILERRELKDPVREHWLVAGEGGLRIPAVLFPATGGTRAVAVLLGDRGKFAAGEDFPLAELRAAGIACLAVDVRGIGELRGLDPRLLQSLGRPATLEMALDLVAAAGAARTLANRVLVVGRGPVASLAALFAGLLDPSLAGVAGMEAMADAADWLQGDVPVFGILPRAWEGPSLARLRELVGERGRWWLRGEPGPEDPAAILAALVELR